MYFILGWKEGVPAGGKARFGVGVWYDAGARF
jgi:hypothetical protein